MDHRTTNALAAAVAAEIDAAVAKQLGEIVTELRALRSEVAALAARIPAPAVTAQDYARLRGVSLRTVRRQIAAGELFTVRVGRSVRIRMDNATQEEIANLARSARAKG